MQDPAGANPFVALSSHVAGLLDRVAAATVGVRSHGRLVASGIVWKPGVVVTASDALEADDDLSLILADGKTVPAQLAGRDSTTDIAVLRAGEGLSGPALPPATGTVKVGHLVVAAGRGNDGPIAVLGMVSVVGGRWQSMRGGQIDGLVRLDLRLEPRAEGSLVVDAEGRFLGMAVLGPRRRPLVIPAATVESIAPRLLAEGHIRRGYLGLGLHPIRLDEALAASHSLQDRRAIMVVSVDPKGPASKGGVLVGDVVLGLDGASIPGVRTLYARLTPESVGNVAQLKLLRAGQIVTAPVTIGAAQTP
jgi:S1-C subfamily serine protease